MRRMEKVNDFEIGAGMKRSSSMTSIRYRDKSPIMGKAKQGAAGNEARR